MSEFIIALTTLPADFDAMALARELVTERLAACVNVLPSIMSVYRWDGKIHADSEQQLVIKTASTRVDALWAALRARHPYDTPEFIVLPITEGSPEYLKWVGDSVGSEK